jgi:hypothetical protein
MKNIFKIQKYFPDFFLKAWENEDGVNFAIALARVSGWLLHVDWWTPYQDAPTEMMKSLRVYVGTDNDDVFDFNGRKSIEAFSRYVVEPIAAKRGGAFTGAVQSTYYSEEQIWRLPLRVKPVEEKVLKAEELLRGNSSYLNKLPVRRNPLVPAHLAADFSFGQCVVFAQAFQDIKGVKATAIIADKYIPLYGYSKLGYCHSLNIHPDGDAEDSFGKQPLENIVARFGIAEYHLDDASHVGVNATLKKNTPLKYDEVYTRALELIALSSK